MCKGCAKRNRSFECSFCSYSYAYPTQRQGFETALITARKADVSRRQAVILFTKHLRKNTTRRSPILILTHQLLLNFKHRLANYFLTELLVLGQKKVAEHRLITRFPEAVIELGKKITLDRKNLGPYNFWSNLRRLLTIKWKGKEK